MKIPRSIYDLTIPLPKSDPFFTSLFMRICEIYGIVRNLRLQCPVSIPVSIMRTDLLTLERNRAQYICSEKTNGIRFLIYFFLALPQQEGDQTTAATAALLPRPMIALMDRSCQMYILKMPSLSIPNDWYRGASRVSSAARSGTTPYGTLLDAELVSMYGTQLTFVVHDLIASCGVRLRSHPFQTRLTELNRLLREAMSQSLAGGVRICDSWNPLLIKQWYSFRNVQWLYEKVIPKLPYPTDGIVFARMDTQVRSGTDSTFFKWKLQYDHTVELYVSINHAREEYVLYSQRDDEQVIYQHLSFAAAPENVRQNVTTDGVYECVYQREDGENGKGRWIPQELREDKSSPNDYATVQKTEQNVLENIGISEICAIAAQMSTADNEITTHQ